MNLSRITLVFRPRLRARGDAVSPGATTPQGEAPRPSGLHHGLRTLPGWIPALAGAAAVLPLVGCLNLQPAPDDTRHFLLTAAADGQAASPPAGWAVGLAPVRLPAHTASSWIAIRTGSNEVHYAETARWAEPLDRNMQRVLGENLRREPGIGSVFLNIWPSSAVQRELTVQFDTLELHASGEIVLGAQWTLRSSQGSALTATHAARVRHQGPRPAEDMPGAVSALSHALAQLTRQVATSLTAPAAQP